MITSYKFEAIVKKQIFHFLILTLIMLLLLIAAYAYSNIFNNSREDTTHLTPIPWETVKAYNSKNRIDSKLEAVIAAQLHLRTSRLRPVGTPFVIYVEQLDYTKAKGTIIPPKISDLDAYVSGNRVWFVVFEGQWRIEGGPEPEPTWTSTPHSATIYIPTPTSTTKPTPDPHGCVYVMIYGSKFGDGSAVGGLKNCEQWKKNLNIDRQLGLDGTRWILQLMHGQELLEDTVITLKITEGEISGSSGCNFYDAKYTIQPKNEIEINELVHTAMACYEPEGIIEQEEQYVSTLMKGTSFHVEGENLFILDGGGNSLLQYLLLPKFEANPEDLIGKTWRLNYADSMEEYELGAFTLWFDGSMLGGTTSCRNYEGIYQPVEDGLQVTSLRMTTDVECAQIELHAEETYTTLLERIDQYNVSPNRLELYTVQNDKLIYELLSNE